MTVFCNGKLLFAQCCAYCLCYSLARSLVWQLLQTHRHTHRDSTCVIYLYNCETEHFWRTTPQTPSHSIQAADEFVWRIRIYGFVRYMSVYFENCEALISFEWYNYERGFAWNINPTQTHTLTLRKHNLVTWHAPNQCSHRTQWE